MQEMLKILITEDHRTVREGLKLIINAQDDMQVVGEADDGEVALSEVARLHPDVVVMDIAMPGMNGLTATRLLRALYKDLKIVALSRHTDDGYLQQALEAGANGYVLKQGSPSHLLNAVREVSVGNSYVDPEITAKIVGGYLGRRGRFDNESGILTDREEEILRLIALGYANKEIAYKCGLSPKTVEVHKCSASKKLGISGRVEIIRYAISSGWLQDVEH